MSRSRAVSSVIATLAVLIGSPARAIDVLAEVTTGKGGIATSLLLDVPLVEGRTHATLCYGLFRARGVFAPMHQACAGLDHAINDRWMVSAVLSATPPVVDSTELPDILRYTTANASLGASFAVGWQSGGFSDVEWALDATMGVTAFSVRETWSLRDASGTLRSLSNREGLVALRPGLGAAVQLGDRWELSLRGSYSIYSRDPLTVGRLGEEDLLRLAGSAERLQLSEGVRRLLAERVAEGLGSTEAGLILGDARSGLLLAPLHFELRPGIAYRLNRAIRAELFYNHQRYVPTQGLTHVLSTRWTVRANDALRLWAAAAVQVDRPDGASASRSLLFTAGGNLNFW